ncbi:C-type lectin domain family 4 member M, partial [Acropora cervicornis]
MEVSGDSVSWKCHEAETDPSCPEHWAVFNNSCYYLIDGGSSKLSDVKKKCKQMSAKLPIIKSKAENTFIVDLMSKQNVAWVWLGMMRKQGKMVWFDNTPAEPSNRALYSAWGKKEPSNKKNEDCAYLDFHKKTWDDNKCDHTPSSGPSVLCQKKRKKDGSSKTE